MREIRQIIVPVDFQSYTDEIVEFAVGIASKLAAKIIFFHVVESVEYYFDFIPTYLTLNDEETLAHAQKKMSALIEKNKETLAGCTGTVSSGDVVDTILEYTQDGGMDLIIMGTHGARGIEKILLGSVADRVIKRAPCPTLVFKPQRK